MRITLQLTPEATERARSTRSRGGHASGSLLGRALVPIHPTTTDASLSRFFSMDVDNQAEASKLVARLLKDPNVEAAYIKPDDEPP